jgi:hypothetical protein
MCIAHTILSSCQVIFMWMMNQSLFQSSTVTWKLKRSMIQKRPVQVG